MDLTRNLYESEVLNIFNAYHLSVMILCVKKNETKMKHIC